MNDKRDCRACGHAIDAAARVCPYCGADPESGAKAVDTQAVLQEVFHTKPRLSTSESVLEYARQRQGVVVAITAAVAFLIFAVLHSFATSRNNSDVTNNPAVPLSEITDRSNAQDDAKPLPLPPLEYEHDGRGTTMRTYIVEPGAVTPPEVVAAQQAQAAAQKAGAPQAQPPRPGVAQPQAAPAQPSAIAPHH
jgi:type IV secretory pathway VirB10-like protein